VTEHNFSKVQFIAVDEQHQGQRIDNFLMSLLKTVPRSRVYKLLRTGEVRVNKGRVKPSRKLLLGDQIRLPPVRVESSVQVRVPSAVEQRVVDSVVYEDDQFIAVNKPAGLAVHGGSETGFGLIDALRQRYPDAQLNLVHRLDRQTSGVLIVARGRKAAVNFQNQLRAGEVRKHYIAVLCGKLRQAQKVDAPLLKLEDNVQQPVVVSKQGKPAHSEFQPREVGKRFSLADIRIETGRTHQIRVHAAHIELPILGDPRYGDWQANRHAAGLGYKRMYLHARQLQMEGLSIQAEPDDDWSALLSA